MLALTRFNTSFEVVEPLLHVASRIADREGITNTPQGVVYVAVKNGLHHGDISTRSMLTVLKVSQSNDGADGSA